MEITHEREGQSIVVYLSGELDHHAARRAIEYLDRLAALYTEEPILLDLNRLTFMDSSGLAVVVNFQRALGRNGRRIVVRGVPPHPMRIFRAAHLDKRIAFQTKEGSKPV